MASLTGNLISSTYQSILKITTNNTASANLNNITDGTGNATALSLSTTSASIAGELTVTGTLNATASSATTASYAVTATTASFATTASNANFLDGLDSTAFTLLSGSNIMTGSITLAGRLSFNAGQGTFVLPSQSSPSPVVGSAYFSGSTLYIYNGTSYLSVALS
jgi:hypothetical protein